MGQEMNLAQIQKKVVCGKIYTRSNESNASKILTRVNKHEQPSAGMDTIDKFCSPSVNKRRKEEDKEGQTPNERHILYF